MTPAQWLLDETLAWLLHAARDLRAADLCAPELPAEALYHCQQAAEKFLKAYLTFHQTPFRKTHELRELALACVAMDASLEPEIRGPASTLSRYAWLFRYPGVPMNRMQRKSLKDKPWPSPSVTPSGTACRHCLRRETQPESLLQSARKGIANMRSKTTRRAALGALAAGFAPSLAAAEPTPAEKANIQLVNDFCAAWPAQDPAKLMSFFAPNCAYRMTETMEPNKGRDAVTTRVTALAPSVQGFEVLDTWARGPMVINERIDRFTTGTLKSWHGVGVFFLKEGKIVEWYDYTIAMERR
jgi:limonene-1,2-epoxide hydrolase/HEPN domain-containing protein